MRGCTPIAVLALAACSAPQGAGRTVEDTPDIDLSGEWGVSRLDGETLNLRVPLLGSPDALVWLPACAGQDVRYRTHGEDVVFYQSPSNGPPEVCDIGYPDDLPRVIDALEGRWSVARQVDGDVLLVSGNDEIELERLPVDRVETLAGSWEVTAIDGEELGRPYRLRLEADDGQIWWEPRCAAVRTHYRIVNDRFVQVEPPPVPPPPPLPDGTPRPPAPVCTIGLPSRLVDAMNAIRAAQRIEDERDGTVRLEGAGRSLIMRSTESPG